MKKIIFSLITLFVIGVNAFAVDFSIGATLGGWGPTFGRGADYKDQIGNETAGLPYDMAFAQVADVRAFIDFIPYFGVEVGFGYAMKSISLRNEIAGNTSIVKFALNQLSIPVFIKGQYEIADMVNIYLGVGPKFNFNLDVSGITYLNGKKIGTIKVEKEGYNLFDMDLTIALGAEFKLAKVHYLGLRVGYDINLLGSVRGFTDGSGVMNTLKFYMDDLAIAVTYRYKFGQ